MFTLLVNIYSQELQFRLIFFKKRVQLATYKDTLYI